MSEAPEQHVTLFDGASTGRFMLNVGAPGVAILRRVAAMISHATEIQMARAVAGNADAVQYGATDGPPEFLEALADFLTDAYGEKVLKESLALTAGATNGLVYLLTQVFPNKTTVYTEELSYFLAIKVLSSLEFPIRSVNIDSDGISVDHLEALWSAAYSPADVAAAKAADRFLGVLYLIPHYQNPTGSVLTPDRCRRLIALARRFQILVICDDVYNILDYSGTNPPSRLFAYDDPASADYAGGHVVSNGSFSKLLAPGLRLGWLEMPAELKRRYWTQSWILISGGSVNTFMGFIVGELLRTGQVKALVDDIKAQNGSKLKALLTVLERELPEGCSVLHVPQGGYFVYLTLPPSLDSTTATKHLADKYDVLTQDGKRFWSGTPDDPRRQTLANGIRLAIAYPSLEEVIEGGKLLCRGLTELLGPAKL